VSQLIQEIFLTSSYPQKKTIKNRFNRGNDTCGSFEEGKKIDRKRGQDRLRRK